LRKITVMAASRIIVDELVVKYHVACFIAQGMI